MNTPKIYLISICSILIFAATDHAQYLSNTPVQTSSGDQSETAIAYDVSNSNHLMATWNDYSNGVFSRPGFAFSTDGGSSWYTRGTIIPSQGYGFDPSCGFGKADTEYCAYVASSGSGNYGPVDVSVSTNDGGNWTTYQVSTASSDQDKPYLTVDNTNSQFSGNVYVAWRDFSNNGWTDIWLATLTNGGQTRRQHLIQQLSNSDWPIVNFAEPAVGPDGSLYVAYYAGTANTGSPAEFHVARSTDGGQTFPQNTTMQITGVYQDDLGSLRVSSLPSIAVDPTNGYVYLAYTQYDNGDLNVYFSRSTNEGSSWSAPVIVTETTASNQFFPALSVSSVGIISLAYYQGTSSSVDVYVAESFNHGSSFDGFDTRVTSTSSNPSDGKYYSDYMGTASAPNGDINTLWTYFNSQSGADIYFSSLNASYYSSGPIKQTMVVPKGQTIAFQAGSTTDLQNGSGLVVSGNLIAYGTPSQPITLTSSTGGWGGITFNSSTGGDLENCTISYASSPVIIDTANVTITGCTINNSSFYGGNSNTAAAIQVWDANPTITNTAIDGESNSWNGMRFGNGSIGTVTGCTVQNLGAGNGIVIQGGSSPSIISTRITGNYYYGIIANTNGTGNPVFNSDYINDNGIVGGSKYYQGIYFLNSSGHMNLDTVSNSNVGVYCYDYCTTTSGQAGENIIIDNNTGIEANTYSSPVFGYAVGNPPVTYDGTCNQIYSNATDNLYAVNHSSIKAEYNWWGHYPPTGGFYADGTSSLDYTNGLISPAACPSSGSPTIATNSMISNTVATPVQTGLWDEDAGYWMQATAEYVGILKDTSSIEEKRYALERLYHVFQVSKDTSMFRTFESLADSTGPLTSMAQEILANAYLGTERLSVAETMANDLISQYPGTGITKRALILLASLYQFNPSYSQVSSAALSELKTVVANTTDAGLIAALTIGPVNASSSTPASQNKEIALGKDSTSSAPFKLELGNYPNPFNPTTVIKYEIPKDIHVTIRVYDVLGREIATLVDGNETAGIHEVNFDGSRFASGVYFYRLTTPNYSKVMKMLMVK